MGIDFLWTSGGIFLALVVILLIAGTACLFWVVSGLGFKREHVKKLRGLDLAELERRVFAYDTDYFDFIGHDHMEVKQFRMLIEKRDIEGLKRSWPTFHDAFRTLERRAGHEGRPKIMEHYFWYELELRELARRQR